MPTASDRRISHCWAPASWEPTWRGGWPRPGLRTTAESKRGQGREARAVWRQDRHQSVRSRADADVVIVMLSDGPVVEQVLFCGRPTPEKAGQSGGARLGAGGDEPLDTGRNLPGAGAKAGGAGRPLYRRSGVWRRARCAPRQSSNAATSASRPPSSAWKPSPIGSPSRTSTAPTSGLGLTRPRPPSAS